LAARPVRIGRWRRYQYVPEIVLNRIEEVVQHAFEASKVADGEANRTRK
jgi:hypothetical protein